MSDWTATNTSSAPLTVESLERAIETIRQVDEQRALAQAQRAQAWAELRLDYDAMTDQERWLVTYAQSVEIIHPRDAERVRAIVERCRR